MRIKLPLKLFIIFWFFIFHSLSGESNKAFYAISSLRFYLEAKLDQHSGEELFEEDDIIKLWDKAEEHSNLKEIVLAKSYYYKSLKGDLGALLKASNLIQKTWTILNPYNLENPVPPVIAKGLDHRKFLLKPHTSLYRAMSRIFHSLETLANPESFARAGFVNISERPSGMFVAKHEDLKGYLVKAYIDSEKSKSKDNWEWCVFRCWGVLNIKNLIKEKKLKHFVVPKKRIFPLIPLDEDLLGEDLVPLTIPVALLVTDMHLVEKSESKVAWKEIAKRRHIQELYCILSHGYSSCCLPSNIPYTRKGKFTCIDTEIPERKLPYHHVGRYLSKKMEKYFNKLVKTGGKGLPF